MRRRALTAVVLLLLVACEKPKPDTRPAELRAQLARMRSALREFHAKEGRYPHSLNELVPKYLPSIPRDPYTNSTDSWRLSTEDVVRPNADFTTGQAARPESYVIDVHSGAGAPYSSW